MQMALLLSTDDWDKIPVLQEFLKSHPKTVWRTRRQYTPEYLESLPYPLNVYFFHRNIVRYRARCTRIDINRHAQADYRIADVPPEYRSDPVLYSLYIVITKIDLVTDTHIRRFPKWEAPKTSYERGQLGLLKVNDILAAQESERP